MKGVILAGGLGTRLYPCTSVVNKHLLPIYDKPMVYYPIETLVKAGCKDLLIVTGDSLGDFAQLIGNGKQFGLNSVLYAYQENPTGGIADALKLAKSFVGHEKFVVVLGDNLILDDISSYIQEFEAEPEGGCKLFIKEIENPTAFGVAEITNGRITNLIEKPQHPPTNYAVIGVYMYDHRVFDLINSVRPSKRGELEITDVNMAYVAQGQATYAILNSIWLDMGGFKSMFEANRYMARLHGVQDVNL
uniref:glucose-1-phosphate thymidylyltransferase n=1 Tax=viral metagenome TaxID=1070528 RepID=A0A6C0BLM0_9ZZZZ